MSRRILIVGMAAGLIIALTAGLAVVTSMGERSEEPPPMDAETAAATSRFLDGDGAPLVALDSLARPLLQPTKGRPVQIAECEKVVVPIYERFKDVNFTDLAVQVPDPVLARLMLAEQAAVFNGLAACDAETIVEAAKQFELAGRSADLVARRLESIGR